MTTAVPAELAAAVEEALTRACEGGSCPNPAAWVLVAPCGHLSDLCNPCALTVAVSLLRAIAQGSIHECGSTGVRSSYADFRWQLVP